MPSQTEFSAVQRVSQTAFDDIGAWFDSELGQHIINTETAMLDQLLPQLFGYHLTQFSVQDRPVYGASPIQNKLSVGLADLANTGVVASPASLPFADDSIDVVLAIICWNTHTIPRKYFVN